MLETIRRSRLPMNNPYNHAKKRAWLSLSLLAVCGIALVLIYPDGFQQDSGYHFLFSRWGWKYPYMFVGVWARPLYTFLYGFPALIGYQAARYFTVLISVAVAWQTWRLARDMRLERPWLAVPLIAAQPSFFILMPDLLTEPLYALVFVLAIRLHLRGKVKLGMLLASFMLLARPEGFFHGVMWGIWVLFDKRVSPVFWRRLPASLLLATGGIVWWLSAWIITRDPLFIKHNWPQQWHEGIYGSGIPFEYIMRLPEITGLLLLIPFLVGLVRMLRAREFGPVTSSFLLLFLLHLIFRTLGVFGDAGYPRYMVCVAPAIAVITLKGWNLIAEKLESRRLRLATGTVVMVISLMICLVYMDGLIWIRDTSAVKDAYAWFREHPRPVTGFLWSHTYMAVLFDRCPTDRPDMGESREASMRVLSSQPEGTLVFWDAEIGPAWYHLTDKDIEAAGYQRLFSRKYELRGRILGDIPFKYGGIRKQEMHLFYRDRAPLRAGQ